DPYRPEHRRVRITATDADRHCAAAGSSIGNGTGKDVHTAVDLVTEHGNGRRSDGSVSASQNHREYLLRWDANPKFASNRYATRKHPYRQHVRAECGDDREIRTAVGIQVLRYQDPPWQSRTRRSSRG